MSTARALLLTGVALLGCHAQQPVVATAPAQPPGQPSAQTLRTVITPTTQPPCTLTQEDPGGGDSTQRCPGVAGYSLLLLDSDSRMSATVLAPGGSRADLNAWSIVTHAFSTIAGPAQWRVTGPDAAPSPHALVLRFDANEDASEPSAITTYIAVVKLDGATACIVDSVTGPDAERRAVDAADHAGDRPCLAPR